MCNILIFNTITDAIQKDVHSYVAKLSKKCSLNKVIYYFHGKHVVFLDQ